MHTTIQIIVLFQGVFLLFLLWQKRVRYRNTPFRLLFASLLALILFVIGDENGLIAGLNWDLFFLDNSLFIVFLFLFIRYVNSSQDRFNPRDALFFIPFFLYLLIELVELIGEPPTFIEALELVVELAFLTYLIAVMRAVLRNRNRQWVLYLIIPMSLLMCVSMVHDAARLIGFEDLFEKLDGQVDVFLSFVVALTFYFITFKLSMSPDEVIPENGLIKYSTSNLSQERRDQIKSIIMHYLGKEKIYLRAKLSINELANEMNIPRQYITEVISTDLNSNFNDLVNKLRVEEFILRLEDPQNAHFTLQGLAEEVGFSSKSSFYAIFKKIKGLTPSEYKRKYYSNT